MQVGHFGKKFDFALGHGAGLFGAAAGRATRGGTGFARAGLLRTTGATTGLLSATGAAAALLASAAAVATFLLAIGPGGATRQRRDHLDDDLVVLRLDLNLTAVDLLGQLLFGFFQCLGRGRGDVGFENDVFFAVVGGLLADRVDRSGL